MAFRIIVLTCFLAYANAGILGTPAVATYSAAPAVSSAYFHQAPLAVESVAAIHAPAIGASHQSVERSLGGAQSISHYSKAVDSAFSSVRKYDTRITNDALSLAHGPIATYQAPFVTKAVAPALAYSGAPALAYSAAPALAYSAAPAVSSSYLHRSQPIAAPWNYAPSVAAPLIQSYNAPIVTKSVAPVVRSFASPLLQSYGSPLVTKAEPLTVSAGPVVTKAALAYSPATVVAHTTFTGLGTAYEW